MRADLKVGRYAKSKKSWAFLGVATAVTLTRGAASTETPRLRSFIDWFAGRNRGARRGVQRDVLVGHFAVALLAKRAEPRLSLGTTVIAATLADLLLFALVIAGVEQIDIVRGRFGAANYFTATDIAWSHSLAMGLAWALALGAAHRALKGSIRAAIIVGAAVLSHWCLDALSHPPHLPLAPAAPTRVGLGLWTSVPATLLVEGGLWTFALILYVRATRSVTSAGRYVFWGGIIVMTLSWYNNIAGAPPSRPEDAATASLIFFLLWVGWGYWMNRARRFKQGTSSGVEANALDAPHDQTAGAKRP